MTRQFLVFLVKGRDEKYFTCMNDSVCRTTEVLKTGHNYRGSSLLHHKKSYLRPCCTRSLWIESHPCIHVHFYPCWKLRCDFIRGRRCTRNKTQNSVNHDLFTFSVFSLSATQTLGGGYSPLFHTVGSPRGGTSLWCSSQVKSTDLTQLVSHNGTEIG